MLYSGGHYRAGVIIAHERKRNAGKGMGASGTTLAAAGFMRSTGAVAHIVLGTNQMPGVLAGRRVWCLRRVRQPMQHWRTAKRDGQQQGKYETRDRHGDNSSTRSRHRQLRPSLHPTPYLPPISPVFLAEAGFQ